MCRVTTFWLLPFWGKQRVFMRFLRPIRLSLSPLYAQLSYMVCVSSGAPGCCSPKELMEFGYMNLIIAAILAIGLLAYLVYALLKPEKFQ